MAPRAHLIPIVLVLVVVVVLELSLPWALGMSPAAPVRIKPHHFIDILCDIGRGQTAWQPHPYGHAVHTVAAAILADPDVLLEMELGADDICAPCRHNVGGLCDDVIDTSFRPAAPKSKREYNLLIDRRWCERLGLAQGDRLTARQFAERLRDRMGDTTDIYREVPAERATARARDLCAGITRLLEGIGDPATPPSGTPSCGSP